MRRLHHGWTMNGCTKTAARRCRPSIHLAPATEHFVKPDKPTSSMIDGMFEDAFNGKANEYGSDHRAGLRHYAFWGIPGYDGSAVHPQRRQVLQPDSASAPRAGK